MSVEPGTRLGSFEVVSQLGAGGMGIVYRAKDLKLGREVALKVLREEFASDADRLRRFEQEARSASALNHPNIVHIYDIGQDANSHYIAMELVEGVTLRTMLGGSISIPQLVDIGAQIAKGLAKAHDAGIVHRDLKPENVALNRDGFVKILDFGLAKLTELPFELHSEMATMVRTGTRPGLLIGTVEYMSPEQAAGRSVDYRSDQFSLGLLLYEMVTGEIAFRRETAPQTLASIIESEPKPIVSLNANCPETLNRIIARCLEKHPDDRFASTRELAATLQALPSSGTPVSTEVAEPPKLPPVPPPTPTGGAGMYYVQSGDTVKAISEAKLRKRLRKNDCSGMELVRREGETVWQPLYGSKIFKEEVPHYGDPYDWARRRKLQGFLSHASVYAAMFVMFWWMTGQFPFWMGFWGIGLFVHAMKSLPYLFGPQKSRELAKPAPSEGRATLGRDIRDIVLALDGRVAGDDGEEPSKAPKGARRGIGQAIRNRVGEALNQDLVIAVGHSPSSEPKSESNDLSSALKEEISRIRAFLSHRGGAESRELIGEVDSIVKRMGDLARRRKDLDEQTSDSVLADLQSSERDALANVERATNESDRKLFQRQLDVVRARRGAIDKARRVLSRLRVSEEVAEHQIKQLRLDLSRAEASRSPVPELTSRLQDIRHEVDAAQDVDEAIGELLS